jgi:hypothetical protein
MAKQGKRRTMSICLTDIPKEKILIHENGKKYLMLETWDNDEKDKYDNDFSVSVALSKDEVERSKGGEKIMRTYLGNGRIWEPVNKMREATPEDVAKMEEDDDGDGLPF